MRPLTPSSITAEFLSDKPFLLLDTRTFSSRYIGSLLAKGVIKSKGDIALPPEIWHNIFLQSLDKQKYQLARVLTATPHGKSTTLRCKLEPTVLTYGRGLAYLEDAEQVLAIERYLAAPDQQHDLSLIEDFIKETPSPHHSPTSKTFSVTVSDSHDSSHPNTFFPPCLFHDITVPDIIGHLQSDICRVCNFEDRHTICPGCTGGVAGKFDAFMGCGVALACPLCLGLDFMRRDKELLEAYYRDGLPAEEELARDLRFKKRLGELGY
ncbi:hypothetical protein P7C71_g5846, partial [Lecanoromycetidae sp. Uapishka_2]